MRPFLCLFVVIVLTLIGAGQKQQTPSGKPQMPAQKPQLVAFLPLKGEGLTTLCKEVETDASSSDSTICLSYLGGFTDGYGVAMARFNHEKQSAFCPPLEVTRQQMARVIVKYGADHPNLLWTGAGLFTAIALKDAYPCDE
jgi:hypothetical protein